MAEFTFHVSQSAIQSDWVKPEYQRPYRVNAVGTIEAENIDEARQAIADNFVYAYGPYIPLGDQYQVSPK